MKGLKNIPSTRQIAKAYQVLQNKQHPLAPCPVLVHYAQWSRLDPRLGELVVKYISQHWKNLHPIELNNCLQNTVWPAVFGLIIEHISYDYKKKNKTELALFNKWSECVLHNVQPAKGELFFIHLYRPGSKLLYEEALYSLKIYKKWGYLASDLMFNKFTCSHKVLLSPAQRREVLNKLLKKRKTFKVIDYLKELNFQIPVKQAQRDLKNHLGLSSLGNTRNKIYLKKT